MDINQHLRLLIGDQGVRISAQAAEIDALREQLAEARAKHPDLVPSTPEPSSPDVSRQP